MGICEYITEPRITAAVRGKTPDGSPIEGDYKFIGEFPRAEGIRLLALARNARCLFDKQQAREKRRPLDFLVSNCSLKNGQLTAEFRQPFYLLAGTTMAAANAKAANVSKSAKTEIWLGGRDSNPDTVVQSHVSYH